jgi:macrolide-specific efflux system membrane fusion protein
MMGAKTKSRKTLWLLGAGVVVIVAVISVIAFKKDSKLEVSYREIQVKRQNLEVKVEGTGTVQPENRVEIKPPVAGRVEQVLAKEGQVVKKGQILAWMSSTERAALLDAARSKGPEEYKKWSNDYNPTPILAPINGTVILRNVESGQTFTNVDSVFVMSDRLTVKALVDETDIAEIKLNQEAKIVLDAYPKETINAKVDQIAFDAKTVNNVTTYVVDVLPKNAPAFMRSGMTANVTFFVATKENVLAIPNDALRVKENKFYILVRDPEQKKPIEKPVEVGITDGKKTEIVNGLNEGETILAAEVNLSKEGKTQGGSPFSPMGGRRGTGGR